MEYDVDIRKLSPAFYAAYPYSSYPEIMQKGRRAYTCLLIDTHEDYLICVPFRSDMNHKQGFHFKGTKRSVRTRSGLDYKKTVLITDSAYIDEDFPAIDDDERKAVMINIQKIAADVIDYIDVYRRHIDGTHVLSEREFKRRYEFSTLPYFHDILHLLNCR